MFILRQYALLTLAILWAITAKAQEKSDNGKAMTRELGLNVTSLLTDLLGNNNRGDAGRYLLSYKKLTGMSAFRLGLALNFKFDKENSRFNNTLTNQNFQVRLGKEWRHDITSKLQYYFGVDGIAGYTSEQSAAVTGSSSITQKDNMVSLGGGPVLGFQYAIFDRLLIGTEGSLYATFNSRKVSFNTQTFGGPTPQPIPDRSNTGVAVQTNLPTSLFLILKF
jgi:hypothetical protein